MTFWVYRLTNILLAPLYFHFGHHDWFIDAITTLSDLVDIDLFFFIAFAFIGYFGIYRNETFQVFAKNFYKNYLSFLNTLPLFTYFSYFYSIFVKSTLFLIDSFYSFFKKKK